jgi:Zn-dependent M28 family amino/carboxypeptidase
MSAGRSASSARAQRLPAEQTHVNLETDIAGGSRANEIVLVGAHYDSLFGTKGANDNATGVAALLEIARVLKDSKPARTIRFVAFANEEPPFFKSEAMGSRIYARAARARGDDIVAMYSLETIGYYSNEPGAASGRRSRSGFFIPPPAISSFSSATSRRAPRSTAASTSSAKRRRFRPSASTGLRSFPGSTGRTNGASGRRATRA